MPGLMLANGILFQGQLKDAGILESPLARGRGLKLEA